MWHFINSNHHFMRIPVMEESFCFYSFFPSTDAIIRSVISMRKGEYRVSFLSCLWMLFLATIEWAWTYDNFPLQNFSREWSFASSALLFTFVLIPWQKGFTFYVCISHMGIFFRCCWIILNPYMFKTKSFYFREQKMIFFPGDCAEIEKCCVTKNRNIIFLWWWNDATWLTRTCVSTFEDIN